jgi:hypothetical protein
MAPRRFNMWLMAMAVGGMVLASAGATRADTPVTPATFSAQGKTGKVTAAVQMTKRIRHRPGPTADRSCWLTRTTPG